MYITRKLNIGSSKELENLALIAGELYSRTVVTYWRIVRKKGIYLSQVSMEKICNSSQMHAHSADAAVQSFYHALKSWYTRLGIDTKAKPPRSRRKYFKVQWKKTAIRLKDGFLVLSNGRGNEPLRVAWKWDLPVLVDMVFKGTEYQLIATYKVTKKADPLGDKAAGIDLGEVHPGVAYDGENTYLSNGRHLRSLKQKRNKVLAHFQYLLSRTTKGSNRDKKLKKAKRKRLKKLDNQILDVTHKQSTLLISTLYMNGVQTIIIGDIRYIRLNGKNLGKKANQKVHQMSHGIFRHHITYKAELLGMKVSLINEAYTSQECPQCRKRNKTRTRNYRCSCGFKYHRDGVGAINIFKKYRGEDHVVGAMVSPISLRYQPHMKCSL